MHTSLKRTNVGAVGDLEVAIGISILHERTGAIVQLVARDTKDPRRKTLVVELDREGYASLKALIAKTDEVLALKP